MITRILLFLFLARTCFSQTTSQTGNSKITGNTYVGSALYGQMMESFAGGANGSVLTTNALTNASSLTASVAIGTWAFASSAANPTTAAITRMYTTNGVLKTLNPKIFIGNSTAIADPGTMVMAYNHINTVSATTWEEWIWTLPVAQQTISACGLINPGPDGTGGASGNYDFVELTGSGTASVNWKEGASSATAYFVMEGNGVIAGPHIPANPHHWYFYNLIYSGGCHTLYIYDAQSNMSLVGISQTQGKQGTATKLIVGQAGHSTVTYAATTYFGTVIVNMSGLTQYAGMYDQWMPADRTWRTPKPMLELVDARQVLFQMP